MFQGYSDSLVFLLIGSLSAKAEPACFSIAYGKVSSLLLSFGAILIASFFS